MRKQQETSSIEEECYITSNIHCQLVANGKPCDEIITKPGSCEPVDVYFKFTYCNTKDENEEDNDGDDDANQGNWYVGGEINVEKGGILSEPIHDDALEPQTCRVLGHESTVDSCSQVLEASIQVSAWEDNEMICTSSDVYKVFKLMTPEVE
jgi:hypothetical protein